MRLIVSQHRPEQNAYDDATSTLVHRRAKLSKNAFLKIWPTHQASQLNLDNTLPTQKICVNVLSGMRLRSLRLRSQTILKLIFKEIN